MLKALGHRLRVHIDDTQAYKSRPRLIEYDIYSINLGLGLYGNTF